MTDPRAAASSTMLVPKEDEAVRHYASSELPTLLRAIDLQRDKDVLLQLYGQACSTWRELVGIRFKLLAIVPAVSLALLATVLSAGGPTGGLPKVAKVVIALVAMLATLGLLIYDARNSTLHDDLISRARKIEQELGVHTGVFRGRVKSKGIVSHGSATNLIYASCLLGWAFALVLLLGPG